MVDNALSQFKTAVAESTGVEEAEQMVKFDFQNVSISNTKTAVLSLLFRGFRLSQLQL